MYAIYTDKFSESDTVRTQDLEVKPIGWFEVKVFLRSILKHCTTDGVGGNPQ